MAAINRFQIACVRLVQMGALVSDRDVFIRFADNLDGNIHIAPGETSVIGRVI